MTKRQQAIQRIGFGYDIHKFVAGRKFILGGVRIPYHQGLLGHSDADVLLHAICDALLGAAGQGDIGKHFPDTNRKYKNISSIRLLENVHKLLTKNGYEVVNIDSTVVLQWPKIGPHSSKMVKKIASTLKVKKDQISIKATTNEGLGFLGRGVACAAYAVAAIKKRDNG